MKHEIFCQVKLQKAKARWKWHEVSLWKICLSQFNSNPKLALLGETLSPFWFALKTHDIFQRLDLQCPTSLGCPDILTAGPLQAQDSASVPCALCPAHASLITL